MMGVMMTIASLQCGGQFAEADRTIAIPVEFAEDVIGLGDIGAARAKRVFEFRFVDFAVIISVDLRKQVGQCSRPDGGRRSRRCR